MVKILFTSLLLSFSFSTTLLHAQKITNGIIKYDITYPEISEEFKNNMDVLPKTMAVFFKENKSRIELYTIFGTNVILSDKTSKLTYVLTDMMGKKIAMLSTEEDVKKIESENAKEHQSTIINLKKKRKIAGYSCKGILVQKTSDNKTVQSENYYTEELPAMSFAAGSELTNSIPGMLMEYDMVTNGLVMHIRANKVEEKTFPDSVFSVPSTYEIVRSQIPNKN